MTPTQTCATPHRPATGLFGQVPLGQLSFGQVLCGTVGLALGLTVALGPALAEGSPGGGRGHYFKKVSAKLARALEAVQATAEQTATIEQAKREAFAAIKPLRKKMRGKRRELGKLRQSEQPDAARIAQLEAELAQLKGQMKAAQQGFIHKAEQVLSPEQNKALAAFVQQHGGLFQVRKHPKST